MQKIIPFLWFNNKAEEAVRLYTSIFKNSKIEGITHYGSEGAEVSGRPKGTVMTIAFQLGKQKFIALNGGPQFTFTPAISFFVHCKTEQDIDELFKKLSQNGEILMPLDKYPFSEKYAFLKDKFGVAWQLMLSSGKHHIAPCLLFVGKSFGKAEAAIKLYTSVFKPASIQNILHYKEEEGTQAGTVKHASLLLEGQEFMAMDGAGVHKFTFNESISFVVNCKTQEEVDYFWEKLSAGGEKGPCGWLKDKFGISWQIVPSILDEMLQSKDAEKVKRVMQAMLQMQKMDIAALQQAYNSNKVKINK